MSVSFLAGNTLNNQQSLTKEKSSDSMLCFYSICKSKTYGKIAQRMVENNWEFLQGNTTTWVPDSFQEIVLEQ